MAKIMGFLFYFLFVFVYGSSLVHSRSLTQSIKTTVLDVSASIRKTHNVLSFNHEALLNQQEQNSIPSNSLTMQLRSRASMHKPSHSDYKSLTLARLERDSARVKSLITKLDLVANGIAQSNLKPVDMGNRVEFGVEELQGPIISGTSQGSGEYFSRVGIGKPPSQVYMVLDTGSDVNWVQCSPCADCYQQADPIFEPAASASYIPLTCETSQCKSLDVSECRNNTCLYEVSYGDGSFTVGDFVTETITLDSVSVNNVTIGCGHNNKGLFIGATGLLGLASTLEFDSPIPPKAVIAPLHRNSKLDTFYYLGLTGVSVGGELLPIPESNFQMGPTGTSGVIIDSGTAVTRLQSDTYNSLRDSFVRSTKNLPFAEGVSLFDTCYNLSTVSSVEVPTVSFHFPDEKELLLPAKNYLIPVDAEGTFCFAFAPTSSSLSIIGNVQQQGTRVGFDLANSLIGFSPSNC
ncbi:Aspartic protease in GUARD CELL-like protein [Quillaja saponaria]|uniref:Aspartic protease in GUARD CELL-like protein n=1 Tax=Quillaja saponaria TaxID=32244 RepID=A0AAD7LB34_QUISA|nr:Aspartic protease in GUARD CELL-like protein [Quillaja saponaria]